MIILKIDHPKNDHLEKQKLELTADNKKLYTQVESQISSQEYDNIINTNKTLKSEKKSEESYQGRVTGWNHYFF